MDVKTDINKGLTAEQAHERIKSGRSNGNFSIKTKSIGRICRDNIITLFNLVNVVLAIFVFLTGAYRNMLFMGVIFCNIAIGIFQEVRSKKTIDKLSLISAPKAHLLRDGEEITTPVSDICLDDIMCLSSGRQICADAVLMQGELEVDESLITGESDPVIKHEGDELLSGSFVISGTAKAGVIRVGAESYANKIASGAKVMKKQSSAMMRAINLLISIISVAIVPFALILFFKAIFVTGQPLFLGINSTVALVIGMIPEGLVLLTSVALAVSSIRLAMKQTLCQDLYSVEHLARVDVLCLDKTGTITEGCMEVTDVVELDNSFDSDKALSAFAAAMNDPNPTLAAIQAKYTSGTDLDWSYTIPFSSAKKWSAAVFEDIGVYAVGAPSFVLPADRFEAIRAQIDEYAAKGMRVLVLAHSSQLPEDNNLPADIEAKALVVLSDKVRETAPKTLQYFKEQGVTLKVISGDDPVTVANVARKAGLEGADNFVDAATLTDDNIAEAADKYTVFGRVTPYQKLELVKALKAKGHKVAMTGDGVNDVLALKESDCSIAMQSGSDAARNVSQLVLLNSDFSSMPLVVAEGRRAINNIQRSAALFLVKTIFSVLLATIFLFIPKSYPFQPIQLTLINALAVGIPSFLLALEPNHNLVRGSFIGNVLRRAAPGGLSIVIGIMLVLLAESIFAIDQAQTYIMATYITGILSFAVLFEVCRPFNRMRAVMYALLLSAFIGAVFIVPWLFYVVPLSLIEWICVIVIVLVTLAGFVGLTALSKKIVGNFETHDVHVPRIIKKIVISVVVTASAVFTLWLGILLADYFVILNGGAPVFAQKQENGSYQGIFYQVKDSAITVGDRPDRAVIPSLEEVIEITVNEDV